MKFKKKIYDLLNKKLSFDGVKFVQNNGYFQEVPHYHLHIIPHYDNDDKKPIEEVYNIIKK